MREFRGKTAVVTGAGSGIGRALSRTFAAQGMGVVLVDIDPADAAESAELIASEQAGVELVTEQCDVSDFSAVLSMADRAFDRFGHVDLLCNNAGVFVGGFIWDRPPEDMRFALGVNLGGILNGIRAFVPRMIAQGTEGHVVNTSSVAGLFGAPYQSPYAISKFAAFAASESLANDLAAAGSLIKASVLCPGIIRTRITDSDRNRPEQLATELTDDQRFVIDYLSGSVAQGMDPAEVGPMVLDAIRSEEFLILTHGVYELALQARFDDLVARRLPKLPGFA